MLDQILRADSSAGSIGQEFLHHVQLVVAGPYLFPLLAARLVFLFLHYLSVVLDDVGEAFAGDDLLPQVVGLEAVGVGWIASAVIPSLVEGQEPRRLPLEVRTELHLVVIHGEMSEASAKLEEPLSRVAVTLVLLNGVVDCLLGEAVLQFEGGDRQAVDEQAQVQGKLCVVVAITELPGDAEAVLPVQDPSPLVTRRRRAIHQVNVMRPHA